MQIKKLLFKILAWFLLDSLEQAKSKRKVKTENMKIKIQGLTEIEYHHF